MTGLAKRLPWGVQALGLYGLDNVRFVAPVYVDDTLYLEAEVVDKESQDEDRGLLTLKEELYKDQDVLTVTRERKYLVQKKSE